MDIKQQNNQNRYADGELDEDGTSSDRAERNFPEQRRCLASEVKDSKFMDDITKTTDGNFFNS